MIRLTFATLALLAIFAPAAHAADGDQTCGTVLAAGNCW